jgi:hypothetical protein
MNFSDKICRENQNTQFMFSNFFFSKIEPFINVKKYGSAGQVIDDSIIWRMHFACQINKPTEYVILIAFSRQQRLGERASVLCYTYIVCLVGCIGVTSQSFLDKRRKRGTKKYT